MGKVITKSLPCFEQNESLKYNSIWNYWEIMWQFHVAYLRSHIFPTILISASLICFFKIHFELERVWEVQPNTEERLPSFEVFVLLKIFLGSWFCWFIFRIIHFHGYFASLIDWRSSFSLILAYFRICWDFSAKADPSHYFQKCRSLGGTKISFNDVLEPKAADGPFSWHCWDAAAVTGNNFKTKLFHFLIYSKGEVSNFENYDSSSS